MLSARATARLSASRPLTRAFQGTAGSLPTSAALADVVDARRRIFGDEPGNGLRSGRKWLRRRLKGPAALSWYGVSYNDVFPQETGNSVNEDDYRLEMILNRVGKSRMKGKMKHFKKPFLDSIRLEDAFEVVGAVHAPPPPPFSLPPPPYPPSLTRRPSSSPPPSDARGGRGL